MRIREINSAIRNVKKALRDIEKINNKYPNIYRDEIKLVADSVIDMWYDSYDPIFYDRYGQLFKAYSIVLKKGTCNVYFGSNQMKSVYNQSKNWIYKNSFIGGYHGGSRHNGVPYWRTPYPFFTDWGEPAVFTFSPYERMVTEINNTIKEIDTQKNEEVSLIIEKVDKYLSKIIN